jgi:hypothetical protein
MSLYTKPSLIRQLIMEAENINLTPSDDAQAVQASTDFSSADQIATDLTAAGTPPAGAPAAPGMGASLTMPQVTQPQATISKTVINKDIILSQLAELKSIVTNYEKQFEGDDLTPEDANVRISSLLSALVFHAEKFNAFMEGAPSESEPSLAPESASSELPQV